MSRSVTEVVAGWLDAKLTRRSLLSRGAIAATALAAHPVSYTLRPGTAYDSLVGLSCPSGSRCTSGFSEFCCSVNGGYNWCPDGAVIGGWWKADNSSYCHGARYYLDCNATCDCDKGCGGGYSFCDTNCDGQHCHCGQNNCNHWVTGCFQFRYGQCNQDVGCLGRIICRIVSCEAPWEVDPTCTKRLAVDNGVAEQNVACNTKIPAPPPQQTPEELEMILVTCTNHPAKEVEYWMVTSDGYRIPVGSPEAIGGALAFAYKHVTGNYWAFLSELPIRPPTP